MSRQVSTGFEHGSRLWWSLYGANTSITSTPGEVFQGVHAFKIPHGVLTGYTEQYWSSALTTFFFRAMVKIANDKTPATESLLLGAANATTGAPVVWLYETGKLVIAPGAANELIENIEAPPVGSWFVLELFIATGVADGRVTVRYNEQTVYAGTGLNTTPASGTNNVKRFYPGDATVDQPTTLWDNVAVDDDEWCGRTDFAALVPTEGGFYNDLDASPGAPAENWEHVDEIPHDSDGTYLYNDGSEEDETFFLSQLPLAPDSILYVAWCMLYKVPSVDSGFIRPLLYRGGSSWQGSVWWSSSDTDYIMSIERLGVDPIGATDWTAQLLRTTEFGVTVGTEVVRVTLVVLEVEYRVASAFVYYF